MVKTLNKESGKEATKTNLQKNGENPPEDNQKLCTKHCDQDPEHELQPYRVFISYSHEDKDMANILKVHLISIGLIPTMDHEIRVGESFTDEIRDMIECAHVFMPLVTESANNKLWVQQEIGYATALRVPVCSIVVDAPSPVGMNEHIQAIIILAEDIKKACNKKSESKAVKESTLNATIDEPVTHQEKILYFERMIEDRLKYSMIDELVRSARIQDRTGRYDCAMHWVKRQEMLAALTESALRKGCRATVKLEHQRIETASAGIKDEKRKKMLPCRDGISYDTRAWKLRERARFTSFSIPDADFSSPVWDLRDGNRYKQQYDRRLLRQERQLIERYVKCFGCDIIMDIRTIGEDPKDNFYSLETAIRLRLCIDFLLRHDNVRIVIPKHERKTTTLLFIIGDWFASEAVVPQSLGVYDRTMFTRHAPTVLNMIEQFDQDFRDCMSNPDPKKEDYEEIKLEAIKFLKELSIKCEDGLEKMEKQEHKKVEEEKPKRKEKEEPKKVEKGPLKVMDVKKVAEELKLVWEREKAVR